MTIILPDSCIVRLPSILLLHHLNQARQVMDLEENADTDRILTVVQKDEWYLTRMCCCGNNPNVLHTPPTPDADQALQASGIATVEGLDARIRPLLKCPENIYGHIMGGYSMKLQIITPFSRTRENIRAIYSSLKILAAHVETEWVIVYQHNACHELMEWHREKEKQQFLKVTMLRGNTATSYYGNSYRNQALRELMTDVDSWVYFIDDDNIMHPDFPKLLNSLLPDDEVVFFSQVWKNYEVRLEPTHLGVGGIDTAMILARSDIMKQHTWNEEEYTADGLIAEKLAANHKIRKIFEPYAFYNYLR